MFNLPLVRRLFLSPNTLPVPLLCFLNLFILSFSSCYYLSFPSFHDLLSDFLQLLPHLLLISFLPFLFSEPSPVFNCISCFSSSPFHEPFSFPSPTPWLMSLSVLDPNILNTDSLNFLHAATKENIETCEQASRKILQHINPITPHLLKN